MASFSQTWTYFSVILELSLNILENIRQGVITEPRFAAAYARPYSQRCGVAPFDPSQKSMKLMQLQHSAEGACAGVFREWKW